MIRPVIPILVDGKVKIIVVGEPPKEQSSQPAQTGWTRKHIVSLAELLQQYDVSKTAQSEPCGLINRNNLCYFNSVLQALLHCGPFLYLLKEIRSKTRLKIGSSAVLDALIAFQSQYETQAARGQISSAEHFYSVISGHPNFRHLQKGRQEDAQEFMGYLLDTLEQTFDETLKNEPQPEAEEPEQDDWTQVGKHNKSIVERTSGNQTIAYNPILKLFGGKLRNVLRVQDSNPSITIDPFQQVLLDIESPQVTSVQDALDLMLQPESLQLEKNGKLVKAVKQVEFLKVPPVLIMPLKRFTFIRRGDEFDFGKIQKSIKIGSISIPAAGVAKRYEPFAIVYHHGSNATAGHYTTEVNLGSWVCIDDDFVSHQRESANSSAYIVFYRAVDS